MRSMGALALGSLVTAALPPIHLVPALVVAFGGLLRLIEDSRSPRAAFAIGWLFGFAHFLTGLYWIGHSFLVEAERFTVLAAPAVIGLSAFLALFPAAAALLAWLVGGRGLGRVLALAVAWTAAEWLRGHVLTGFPWNLVGHVWVVADAPMQIAAAIGAYGASFVTVVIAALPGLLLGRSSRGRASWWPLPASAALIVALWLGGALRLAGADAELVPDIRLRLVQPNVPQTMKWDPRERERILARFLRLSTSGEASEVTHLVWPETAVSYYLAEEPELRALLAESIPQGGLLLTGSLRRTQTPARGSEQRNSLLAIADDGSVVATYDKAHLVPFGEYMPLRRWLPFEALTTGSGDISPGSGRTTLELAGLPPFSPLICYEIIFPGAVTDPGHRPAWLLNVSNDAWFGASIGPRQHFAMARMRAVEEGLPLVRAANTGISAVVDGYGRVIEALELEEMGVIDAPLPRALPQPTPYARFGDLPLALLLTAGILGALASRRRLAVGSCEGRSPCPDDHA